MDGVEHLHPHAPFAQGADLLRRHGHHAAEVIQDQVHLHPGGSPLCEDGADAVPNFPLRGDIILQENEAPGRFQPLQQVLQVFLACGEIGHIGVFKQGHILPPQVRRQPSPPGPAGRKILLGAFAAPLHLLRLRRHGDGLQIQLLFNLVSVPKEVQYQPHNGDQHNEHDPAGLIGAAARPHIDAHHTQHCDYLQHGVADVDLLPEHLGQSDDQRNLQQQQHRHQRQAQGGRYPSLCFPLNMFHGGILSF